MDGPGGVAEESLDLAADVGEGEGGELDLPVGVEAVDGLDQPDRAHLDDVLDVDAASGTAAESPGGEVHQGDVHLDEGVPGVLVLAGSLFQRPQPDQEQAGKLPGVGGRHLTGVVKLGKDP